MSLFLVREDLEWSATGRPVDARPGNLAYPTRKLAVHRLQILIGPTTQEVVFHVLHAGLDFAFLLRCARRCWVDSEAVVTSKFSVAPVQLGQTAHTKRCSDHCRLQIVRDDHARYAAEFRECSLMKLEPCRRALVEDHLAVLMTAVAQHHHEYPRFARHPCRRIPQFSGVSEVHLRNVARLCLDRNRDIRRLHAARATNPMHQSLQPTQTALEVHVFEPKTIVNRLRSEALLEQRFHLRLPLVQLRHLLRRRPRWQRLLHHGLQSLELRQLVHAAVQHSRCRQGATVVPSCVPADAQLLRCSSFCLPQSMHVRPPRAHLLVRASWSQTFVAPLRPRPSVDPKPDPKWIRLADLQPDLAPSRRPRGGSAWPISTGSAWPIARGSHRPIRDSQARARARLQLLRHGE